MKSNFISTVSHEFKSPLTSIRQMAEMLDGGRVRPKEQRHKYYAALLKESERLSLLIENILDFSEIEGGKKKFHFEKGNLADLTEAVIASMRSHNKFPGMEIDYQTPGQVPDTYFDSLSITQVIQNLIDNACKYSGDSKRIEVAVEEFNSRIRIIVKDFGIGINKDEKDKIFSRFYRAGDELTQKIKGSGIGLTIVKQIVESHCGEITVVSEPGKGSEFQVALPLKFQ
jgi:signal transduction histidine kinase